MMKGIVPPHEKPVNENAHSSQDQECWRRAMTRNEDCRFRKHSVIRMSGRPAGVQGTMGQEDRQQSPPGFTIRARDGRESHASRGIRDETLAVEPDQMHEAGP